MKPKLIRITTIPLSIWSLIGGQHRFMNQFFEVIAISSSGPELLEVERSEGVRACAVNMTRKISPIRDLIALLKLVRIFRKEKPQIVHTHTPKAGTLGIIAAFLSGVPIRLHTVAGLPLLEARGVKRFLLEVVERLTYTFATKIYPNSFGLMDIIIKNGYAKKSKLMVIGNGSSNGIDTEKFSLQQVNTNQVQITKELCGIGSHDFVFIFIGRMVKDKGIGELIAAFVKLSEKYDNALLLLIGPSEHDLDPMDTLTINTIQTHQKIRSMGYQDDVRPFLAVANVLVLPSYREGLPNVPMQACAMGRPCIVSDINGCNEIINHEQNGLIVPPKNAFELQHAMERILLDGPLYVRLASNARESIRLRYDQQMHWKSIQKEYDEQLKLIGFV